MLELLPLLPPSPLPPPPAAPQGEYDLAYLTKIEVINRADFAARITCFDLLLTDILGVVLYTYPFTTSAATYVYVT